MMSVRDVALSDAPAIVNIYNHFVINSSVTFEENEVSDSEVAARIERTVASYPWLVLEQGSDVLGYAYGSAFRTRSAYRFTAETTIYLREDAVGRGLGTRLYRELLGRLRTQGFRSAIGVIALPNEASVRLHEKLGFQKVAHLYNVGRKFGQWVDTGYWQLQF